MKILITGGFGFIGSSFIKYLLDKSPEVQVFVIDNFSKGKLSFLKNAEKNICWEKGDITNEIFVNSIFKKFRPDIVLHLAAKHYIPECEKNPKETFNTNIFGTYIISKLSSIYGVKQFIFSSSASVYGYNKKQKRRKIKENNPLNAKDVYGTSKLLSEKIIESCSIPWSIFRFFNIIGPNDTNDHFIESITEQLKCSNIIEVGNIKSYRDYLYVQDLNQAIYLSLFNSAVYNQKINLGSGKSFSGSYIISSIEKITNIPIKVTFNKNRLRKMDNPYICASITKAKTFLNWTPKISIDQGLRYIIKKKNIKSL